MLLLHLLLSLFNISFILRISIYVSRKKGFNLWAAACRRFIQNTKIFTYKNMSKMWRIWSRYNIVSIFCVQNFLPEMRYFWNANIQVSNVQCFQNKVHYRILNVLRTKCHILHCYAIYHFKTHLGSYPSILLLLLSAILAF